jgi:predicted DNA-binding protein
MEVALRQSTKLTQRKRELIEQLGRTKTCIRGTFEKIREEITTK